MDKPDFMTHDLCYTKGEHVFPPPVNVDGLEDHYWISIGNDVWIGAHCLIGRRISIGDGAVIAAGSVVTKSVPPYAVAGGNPASFIKWRFEQSVIEKLLELRWWEWDIEKIIEQKSYLEDIAGFSMYSYLKEYCKCRKFMG